MPQYEVDFFDREAQYKGRKLSYNNRVAIVEAENEATIAVKLAEKGYTPVKIKRVRLLDGKD